MNLPTCFALSRTMPTGDIWTKGATTDARLAAAGLTNTAAGDFTCTPNGQAPCTAGANIAKLESDLGIVSHISGLVSGTTATISYLAPDSRACTVDLSPNGTNWTRTTDAGGATQRSVSLPGLTLNTTYQYRVLCYYDQTEEWFSFPSDSSNLVTSGTFSTGSG